ncbi:MAG: hypothetical protein ACLQVM_06740 [Terriglobia bacterium]
MEWAIVIAFVLAILILAIALSRKRQSRRNGLSPRGFATPGMHRPSTLAKEIPSRLSATDLLSRVQVLRNGNAQWDEILSEMNPSDDPEIQRLLIEIRGPHMFVPHVALGVIEDGCKRALVLCPKADALAALREATRSQDPFVRY